MKLDAEIWMKTLVFLVVFVCRSSQDVLSCHMDDFIRVLQQVEVRGQGSDPETVLRTLRSARCDGSEISCYLVKVLRHRLTEDSREVGVVLTSDGTTVALGPVLSGLLAGLTADNVSHVHQATLAGELVKTFEGGSAQVGSDGFWDDLASPQVFALADRGPPALTTAFIQGAMDGFILGSEVLDRRPLRLSVLLTSYYNHQLDAGGLDSAPLLIAQRRRRNFGTLAPPPVLVREVVQSEELQRKLRGSPGVEQKKRLLSAVDGRMKEFVHKFLGCPPIITRSMWGARPYRGTPTNLTFPLSHLFIHHTETPKPCLTFQECSAVVRSIQRYHQDQRGWDDIGYNFLVGSDGNVYEGRGWFWRGAHTKGKNDISYGVAFIGNYTVQLPTQSTMALVRYQLESCATGAGRLWDSFILQGHRQVVATDCPGDALFAEIQGWDHFVERSPVKPLQV